MNPRLRLASSLWIVCLLGACGFVGGVDLLRVRHVGQTADAVPDGAVVDPTSPSGYARGMRHLVVPALNYDCAGWIEQTQLLLDRGAWRLRHVDYENAPFGCALYSASPYRWWLGAVATLDHGIAGRPMGLAVERAALWGDPLLHLLLLVSATVFVAWRFGARSAALAAVALAAWFPLAAGYLPGLPDQRALVQVWILWSVLLLLAGVVGGDPAESAATTASGTGGATDPAGAVGRSRWFRLAGAAGGVGLWLDVGAMVPVLAGVALGAVLTAWTGRRDPAAGVAPGRCWRAWARAGAVTSLIGYAVEFAPEHLGGWQLRAVHPLYSLAWLGGGELLALVSDWARQGRSCWTGRRAILAGVALIAVAALPLVLWRTHNPGFFAPDPAAHQLTRMADGFVADDLWSWTVRDGFSLGVGAVVLPVLLVAAALGTLALRRGSGGARAALAFAVGPVLVAGALAWGRLRWWNLFDLLALALVVAATRRGLAASRWSNAFWSGTVALAAIGGIGQVLPPLVSASGAAVSELEARALVERDLAHWLARRVDPPATVVLAPPNETTAVTYYGGLRGVGALDWEAREGVVAVVRIMSATTAEEALELIHRRQITHLLLPSWDTALAEFARLGQGQIEGSFYEQLRHWALPPWLRPVAYQLPAAPGFDGQTVAILEVVDDQPPAVAASRLAEYFVEMNQPGPAADVAQLLRRYPADLGAWAARAQIATARGDTAELAETMKTLLQRLEARGDRYLPWDRRVSLAVVLARGQRADLARAQVQRCLKEADAAKLRGLSTTALYRLLVLQREFGFQIEDTTLRTLARELLPPELRRRLQPAAPADGVR